MADDTDLLALNRCFEIPDQLRFVAGEGGLSKAVITTDACRGEVYLHGAHVTDWTPAGGEPVLFMSGASRFADGEAIRGGVPICFPWFGPKADDPDAPSHGLARIRAWSVAEAEPTDDGVVLALTIDIEPFRVEHRVRFGAQLTMSLTVTLSNPSVEAASFEEALHAYFQIGDVNLAQVKGLENTPYYDKTQDGLRAPGSTGAIWFTEETDRIYLGTQADCVLVDPVMKRSIIVSKEHSDTTVVWNPWTDKAARLSDFGDDEWPQMCCIEACNVADHAVRLSRGESHTMTVTVSVEATG